MIAAHLILKKNEGAKSLVPHLRVFCLSARCAASICPVRAVNASPIDRELPCALEKAKREIVTGRLSESPNFLLPLMLKNSCRKLTHRAATIGAVGVSSAGKAGLLM